MKIKGWECIVNHDGSLRGARHLEEGSWVSFEGGRLLGNGDIPSEVVLWLLRPLLRKTWREGAEAQKLYLSQVHDFNPYNGEPANKDNAPS